MPDWPWGLMGCSVSIVLFPLAALAVKGSGGGLLVPSRARGCWCLISWRRFSVSQEASAPSPELVNGLLHCSCPYWNPTRHAERAATRGKGWPLPCSLPASDPPSSELCGWNEVGEKSATTVMLFGTGEVQGISCFVLPRDCEVICSAPMCCTTRPTLPSQLDRQGRSHMQGRCTPPSCRERPSITQG